MDRGSACSVTLISGTFSDYYFFQLLLVIYNKILGQTTTWASTSRAVDGDDNYYKNIDPSTRGNDPNRDNNTAVLTKNHALTVAIRIPHSKKHEQKYL